MLFWFLFCNDIPSYVKFCDDNLCDDILIMLWWYCGDVVIQPPSDPCFIWFYSRGGQLFSFAGHIVSLFVSPSPHCSPKRLFQHCKKSRRVSRRQAVGLPFSLATWLAYSIWTIIFCLLTPTRSYSVWRLPNQSYLVCWHQPDLIWFVDANPIIFGLSMPTRSYSS